MDTSFSSPSSPPPSEPLNFDIPNELNEQKPSKKRLLETVDQLRKENQELKSQFNEAVSILISILDLDRKFFCLYIDIIFPDKTLKRI